MPWRPDYTTLAELKAYLRVVDTQDDVILGGCLTAASRMVEQVCRRQFGNAAGLARRYDAPLGLSTILDVDDVYSAVGLVVSHIPSGGTPVAITTQCSLWPYNAVLDGSVYISLSVPERLGGMIDVTASWGWATVPPIVRQATQITAARLYHRRDAPFGILNTGDNGSAMYLSKVDPDVAAMLRSLYRWW